MKIEALKKAVEAQPVSTVVNKFILRDTSVCFGGDVDLILGLKESLSSYFAVHIKAIEIVGSAKLGVSLSEERFGHPYKEKSDIDLVVVSSKLFDEAWHELLQLEFKYYSLSPKKRKLLQDCYDDISHGFVSPDKLPSKTTFSKTWWKIFSNLSNEKKYEYRKIRGRLFKNWWFVEKYYSIQLIKLKKKK